MTELKKLERALYHAKIQGEPTKITVAFSTSYHPAEHQEFKTLDSAFEEAKKFVKKEYERGIFSCCWIKIYKRDSRQQLQNGWTLIASAIVRSNSTNEWNSKGYAIPAEGYKIIEE